MTGIVEYLLSNGADVSVKDLVSTPKLHEFMRMRGVLRREQFFVIRSAHMHVGLLCISGAGRKRN